MLHFRSWIAFSVDVADLLELERAFQRGREAVATPEVEEVRGILEVIRDLLDLVRPIEDTLNLLRERLHVLDDLASLNDGEVAQSRQLQREQQKCHHLTAECLGRSHTDLGPSVDIDAAIALTRDRGAHDVHDSVSEG